MIEFTKEEISLCKQVAEKHKKEIEYGDWFLRNDSKFEHILFLRVGEDLITGYIQGEITFMDDMSNVDIKKAIPLWTISDCLEFLSEKGWLLSSFFERLKEPKISSRSWKPKVSCMFWKPRKSRFALSPDYEGGCGYTPLEACLRAVLALLEENKK